MEFHYIEGPKPQSVQPFLEELEQVEILTHFLNTLCIAY